MSDRDTLAGLIDSAPDEWARLEPEVLDALIADRIVSAGWRPPARVITDPAELDQLVFPAIIREIPADPTEFFPQIWEMGFQTGWCRVGRQFFDLDDCTPRLPVLVLYTSTEETSDGE